MQVLQSAIQFKPLARKGYHLPMIIQAKALGKNFNGVTAVDALDFEVEAGSCFGLVGPNGAGKTTTMKMIYCLIRPTTGSLRVFDLDVLEHPRQIKARLGVVPQENNLDPDLSTCRNLETYARYFGMSSKQGVKRCRDLLGFMQLKEKADSTIPALSGGMRRRLIIARALVNDPDLLILDEPTTGLDPQVRHHIWDRLLDLKEKGITLILTTHYMDEAQKLCDRVMIMDQARSVDQGSPAELIRRHCPPYVLEIRSSRAVSTEIQHRFGQLEHQTSGQNLYFYGEDASEFDDLQAAYPDLERLLRPSSLEDVFLKLTGRELRQ
jgi:lipooligosaccharide transport system ATP-binding protein